jgi:hypothetical protein
MVELVEVFFLWEKIQVFSIKGHGVTTNVPPLQKRKIPSSEVRRKRSDIIDRLMYRPGTAKGMESPLEEKMDRVEKNGRIKLSRPRLRNWPKSFLMMSWKIREKF